MNALAYIHSQGYVHRDVKLENVLLKHTDSDEIKLIDLELTTPVDDGRHEVQGSLPYMAPEVFHGRYDVRSDTWSLGVVMFALMTGRLPFMQKDEESLVHHIKHEDIDYLKTEQYSPEATAFLKALLRKELALRPTAQQLLLDPWLARPNDCPSESDLPDTQQQSQDSSTRVISTPK